jgi:hypothetical protein
MQFGIFGSKPRDAPDICPPPTREQFPDDYEYTLAEIIWMGGGIGNFSFLRRRRAEQLAVLLCNPPPTTGDRYMKWVDITDRLEERLKLQARVVRMSEIVTANMSLDDMSRLYSRMCGDPDMTAFVDVPDVTGIAAPAAGTPDEAPQPPLRAPGPSPVPPPPYAPAPENAAAGPPPDERLRIVTFWSIGAQPVPPPPEPASEPIEPAPTPDPRLRAFGRTVYSGAG